MALVFASQTDMLQHFRPTGCRRLTGKPIWSNGTPSSNRRTTNTRLYSSMFSAPPMNGLMLEVSSGVSMYRKINTPQKKL